MELKSNEEKITRALLVSVDTGEYDAQASLDELFELVKSAGADPVLSVTQNLQKIEKGTFVGTGKLAEIAEICESQEIDLLVFDSELSPTQIKNIEAETDVRDGRYSEYPCHRPNNAYSRYFCPESKVKRG